MLRRSSTRDPLRTDQDTSAVPYPPSDPPFVLGTHPSGIRFYAIHETLFLPYAGLQSVHLGHDVLTLGFVTHEVVISGLGLHTLYAHVTEQKLKRIHEQGPGVGSQDCSVWIRELRWSSRSMTR